MPHHAVQGQNDRRAQVVTKAVRNAADYWELSNHQLGKIIGLSDSTISRLKSERYVLSHDSKAWELALLFLRIFRGLDAYMGGRIGNEKKWLNAKNSALGGVPVELMQDVQGLAGVVQYIDCVRGQG